MSRAEASLKTGLIPSSSRAPVTGSLRSPSSEANAERAQRLLTGWTRTYLIGAGGVAIAVALAVILLSVQVDEAKQERPDTPAGPTAALIEGGGVDDARAIEGARPALAADVSAPDTHVSVAERLADTRSGFDVAADPQPHSIAASQALPPLQVDATGAGDHVNDAEHGPNLVIGNPAALGETGLVSAIPAANSAEH